MSKARTDSNLENCKDEDLLAMFSTGNNKAYTEIVKRYENILNNFLMQNGIRADDADDVLQDTFFTLFKYKDKVSEIKKLSTWLFTISINDGIRKAKLSRRFESFDQENIDEEYLFKYHADEYAENPDDFDTSEYDAGMLRNAFDKLEPHYKEVLQLRIDYMEYEEIAELLKIPVGTVKSRINMAKARLKAIILKNKDL